MDVLHAKLVWIILSKESLFSRVIKAKYHVSNESPQFIRRSHHSHFWKSIFVKEVPLYCLIPFLSMVSTFENQTHKEFSLLNQLGWLIGTLLRVGLFLQLYGRVISHLRFPFSSGNCGIEESPLMIKYRVYPFLWFLNATVVFLPVLNLRSICLALAY